MSKFYELKTDQPNATTSTKLYDGDISLNVETSNQGSLVINNIERPLDGSIDTPAHVQKSIENELGNAYNEGKTTLVNHTNDPMVGASISRIATTNNTKVDSSTMVITQAVKPSNSSSASVMAASEARASGFTDTQITGTLLEQGYNDTQIVSILKDSNKVTEAIESGYSEQEVRDFLFDKEPDSNLLTSQPSSPIQPPTEDQAFGRAYRALTGTEKMTPKELLAKLEVVHPNTSLITTNIAGFFGNEEAARNAKMAADASSARIITSAADRGLQLEVIDGEYWATTPEGPVKVTPEWWRSFWESKGELIGGVSGAIGGAALGATAAANNPLTHFLPFVKGATILGASITGAAIGSMGGTELDYLHNAIILQEDMNAEIAAHKALKAAELSVIADSAVFAGVKIVGKSWNGIVRAKAHIAKGFFDKAKTSLKEHLFITDEQAAEIVEQLSRVAVVPGRNESQREIASAMLTQPGSEGIVKASAAIDAKASASISHAIDVRAKDLLAAAEEIAGKDIGRLLKGELESYTKAVKENFGRVKAIPAQSPRANDFTFDYNKLVIGPVLKRLSEGITDPTVAYKFAVQSNRIKEMSSSRSFADLLELRQLVNDFKFNKRIRSTKDFDMLNNTISKIDEAITTGAHHILDKPKEWLKEFGDAKTAYAKMKSLEKNQIIKIINRVGVDEKVIGKALAKYAYSIDDTFVEVLASLPKHTRAKVEGSVLETLAEKFTAGLGDGQRATNFPMLAKDLQGITFTTVEARTLKRAVMELAEVFKNDIPLAQSTGNIQVQKFQSFLTADPVVRAKFELASGMFNYIKGLAPGAKARTMQLVKTTAEVLENPVNSKAIKRLIEESKGSVAIAEQTEKLLAATTKAKATSLEAAGMPVGKFYGSGKVLNTTGKGSKKSVPLHRIATTEETQQIAEATGVNRADYKALAIVLKERGYLAFQLGTNSIRLVD